MASSCAWGRGGGRQCCTKSHDALVLVSTLDEVARIQTEGREKRAQAELELASLESELKNKLLSMNS